MPEACWNDLGDYDAACCIAQGFCCDNEEFDYTLYDPSLPTHASVGNCDSVCVD